MGHELNAGFQSLRTSTRSHTDETSSSWRCRLARGAHSTSSFRTCRPEFVMQSHTRHMKTASILIKQVRFFLRSTSDASQPLQTFFTTKFWPFWFLSLMSLAFLSPNQLNAKPIRWYSLFCTRWPHRIFIPSACSLHQAYLFRWGWKRNWVLCSRQIPALRCLNEFPAVTDSLR